MFTSITFDISNSNKNNKDMKHTTKKELIELFLGEETYTKKDFIQLAKQLGGLLIILALVNLLS